MIVRLLVLEEQLLVGINIYVVVVVVIVQPRARGYLLVKVVLLNVVLLIVMKGAMVIGVQVPIQMMQIMLVTVVRMQKDMTVAVINVVMLRMENIVVMTLLLNHHFISNGTKLDVVVKTRFVV